MDLGVFHAVEQHKSHNGHRALLRHFSGLVKAHFLSAHAAQVDPLGKANGARFRAETSQPVNAVMAEAAIPVRRRVMKNKKLLWENFV
jgi:hypothetical protein